MKDQSESFKSLNIFVIQSHPGQSYIFSILYSLYYGLCRCCSEVILRHKKIVNNYQLSVSNFPVLSLSAQIPCDMIYKLLLNFVFS